MLRVYKQAVIRQYLAALAMFEDCIRQCPDDQWMEKLGRCPFWQVAYHTVFYTDLYLSLHLDAFEQRDIHRENYHFLGRLPYPPFDEVVADIPYDKESILAYVEHCRAKVSESVDAETAESLDGPCGFWWYEIPRSEFHLNNIRHLQHHTAQMVIHLRQTADIGIDWVGHRAHL